MARLSPKRQLNGEKSRCLSYALSLFTASDKARKHFRNLRKKCRNIHKSIGTQLAEGSLSPDDGVATEPAHSGHFSLFENRDAKLTAKFSIVESLIDGKT